LWPFFLDCRWALLGIAASSLLNSFAVNIYSGIATLAAGAAVVLTIRLVLHPWVRQLQSENDRAKRELVQAIKRKNELARKLGWPTT